MTCRNVQRMLSAFIDGEHSPEAAARISDHLHSCPACRAELAAIEATSLFVKDLPGAGGVPTLAPGAPPAFRRAERRNARREKRWADLPGIIAEGFLECVRPAGPSSGGLDAFQDTPPGSLGRIYLGMLDPSQ